MQKTLILLIICFLNILAAWAGPSEKTLIEAGRKAYEAGRFDSARTDYQTLVDKGYQSFELFYNLGNTYFKLDKIPYSILYYERARKLNPHNADLKFNLKLANSRIQDRVETLPRNEFLKMITEWFSTDTWALLSVVFFVLFLIALFFFFYLRTLSGKRFFLGCSIICFLLSAGMFFIAIQSRNLAKLKEAVIFASGVVVKSAPGSSGNKLFMIHEGLKVQIKEISGTFAKIELADGNIGWIPLSALKEI